jgi:hypothetical protein
MSYPNESMLTRLSPGLEVKTFDGRKLGMVQAVGDSGFLTRRKYREGFWLPEGLVRDVDNERVLLHIDSRVLPRYSQPAGGRKGFRVRSLSHARTLFALGLMVASGLAVMGSL